MRIQGSCLLALAVASNHTTFAFLSTQPNSFRRCKSRLLEEDRVDHSVLQTHHGFFSRPAKVSNKRFESKLIFPKLCLKNGGLLKQAPAGLSFTLLPFLLGQGLDEGNVAVHNVLESLKSVMEQVTSAGQDANFQAKVFNDLSHIALDMATLVGAPASAVAVRLLAVIGRYLVLAADYLPDHFISPDELSFQMVMLCVAWSSFLKSLQPLAVDLMPPPKNVTMRDGRAYSLLFQPSGVTWSQYKALSAYAMDWISLKVGDVVDISTESGTTSNRYMYWLYKGNVTVSERNMPHYTVSRGSPTKGEVGKAFLGDIALLHFLDEAKLSKLRARSATKSNGSATETTSARAHVIGGQGGATLLRIDASKLLRWIEEFDETLEQPVRKMLLRGIQEKLFPERGH